MVQSNWRWKLSLLENFNDMKAISRKCFVHVKAGQKRKSKFRVYICTYYWFLYHYYKIGHRAPFCKHRFGTVSSWRVSCIHQSVDTLDQFEVRDSDAPVSLGPTLVDALLVNQLVNNKLWRVVALLLLFLFFIGLFLSLPPPHVVCSFPSCLSH
jgi:hypothetical protein